MSVSTVSDILITKGQFFWYFLAGQQGIASKSLPESFKGRFDYVSTEIKVEKPRFGDKK